MKHTTTLILAGLLALSACNGYDDSLLKENIDAIETELSSYEQAVSGLKAEMNRLTSLMNSSFISYINKTENGDYVISYKTASGLTNTITLATSEDILTLPIVGAGEYTDGKLYWRITPDNGTTWSWITDKDGNMMPVGGTCPEVAIDADGFWTVNGERITGTDGNPVLANDVANTLFRSVEVDEETSLVIFTLTDGTSFSVVRYEALDILFEAATVTAIPDTSVPAVIKYSLTGTEAEEAYVDYFTAYNVDITIDRYAETISAKLADGAEEGNVVIMVTAGEITVLKPLFFTAGTAEITNPSWDAAYGTGVEIQLPGEFTEFEVKVSSNISYDVSISEDASSWLKMAAETKAELSVASHNFVADYYENDSGADRIGILTFSNRPYGVTLNVTVRQSPVIPDTPSEPGISTGADLAAFAKAVNAGTSTSRWQNSEGAIVLLNDIDLTGLTDWTPIGSGNASGTPAYANLTNPFTGVFDGQGHTISGIGWTFDVSGTDTDLYGLFGALKGAEIRNLTLGTSGDSITLTGSSTDVVAVGTLVGYAENSTIKSVTSNVNISLSGDNPDGTLMMIGGIAGCVKTSTIGGKDKADAVTNKGSVKALNISNTANGGTGMNIAGICAFSLGSGTLISYCYNYGEVSAPSGRGGGIVGTMGGPTTGETFTTVSNCTNAGTIRDDEAGIYNGSKENYNYKRMGGIVGGTADASGNLIEYCTNSGNVFSQVGCRCGGFAGHNKATITGCVNKGIILANITYSDGEPQHGPGWACGYSGKGLVTSCVRGGKVGEWDTYKDNPSSAPEATNDNALCYKNSTYFNPDDNL